MKSTRKRLATVSAMTMIAVGCGGMDETQAEVELGDIERVCTFADNSVLDYQTADKFYIETLANEINVTAEVVMQFAEVRLLDCPTESPKSFNSMVISVKDGTETSQCLISGKVEAEHVNDGVMLSATCVRNADLVENRNQVPQTINSFWDNF